MYNIEASGPPHGRPAYTVAIITLLFIPCHYYSRKELCHLMILLAIVVRSLISCVLRWLHRFADIPEDLDQPQAQVHIKQEHSIPAEWI